MPYTLVYFPDSYINLQKEIPNHPDLVKLLENQPNELFEVRLAEVAAYCGVILDGYYIPKQLEELCEILESHLILKRKGVAFIN